MRVQGGRAGGLTKKPWGLAGQATEGLAGVVNVCLSLEETDNVVLSASNGRTVIFQSSQLRASGRTAAGVRGIRINEKTDKVISLQISQFEFQEDEEEVGTSEAKDDGIKEEA